MSLMQIDDFKKKWEEFRNQKGYLQRIDPQHPLDFFIGIDDNGNDELVLFTEFEPAEMRSGKAITIEKRKRHDGKWSIQIQSMKRENQDVFARLCWDLVESSYSAINELSGIELVISRYIKWQKLFESLSTDLSKEVIKGLIGELQFAVNVLSKHYDWDIIIEAWRGPDGADRDFLLEDYWFEVKTIVTGKITVSISSLNQLETDTVGVLVVTTIDASAFTDINSYCFSSVINEVRHELSSHHKALFDFEEKLISIGYIDKKEYSEMYFSNGEIRYYKVDEIFPKLVTSNVPSEVVSAKYELLLTGLDPWKTGEDIIWH